MRTTLLALVLLSCFYCNGQFQFAAGSLRLSLNSKGSVSELRNTVTNKDYLPADTIAPLLTLVSNNKRYTPSSLNFNKVSNIITLQFEPEKFVASIKLKANKNWLSLELIKAEPAAAIDAIVWGPLPTSISKTVGETIGVVRDDEVAIGMFVLNIKTLGGDYPNSEGSTWTRGIAAVTKKWGSNLQAYAINRDKPRNVDAWGGVFKHMPVPVMKGETVVGSKIAIFSCDAAATLNTLEEITLAEKLPYPTSHKTWWKKSALFGKSYLISSFGENEIDEMIGYTKRAGLYSLYHEGPFKSWGHYIPDPKDFPNGRAGLKACADKAHAAGLLFGVHTLTNFINTDDPYVSPVPDERLSVTGFSILVNDIDTIQKDIEVASPDFFNQVQDNNLHTVKIGKELIRYKSVTAEAPYKLTDCQRGAFGTIATPHKKNAVVGKLFDHGYKVFFPNIDLQREIARNLAALFNETGIDHFDLDGHEGCLASGQGDYALELFAKDVYENINHETVIGTSNSKTFFWNIGAYYNWGEPWYGGFKESMQQYRIDNQALFDRNFMPHMMGWYLLNEHTTLPEMEWMLARAAGYNAGFAMVARPKSLRANPLTPQLLDAIHEWENARNTHAFSKAQEDQLKNAKNEFHLEKIAEGKWSLSQYVLSPVFTHEKFMRQPGEPTQSNWQYKHEGKEAPLQFRLTVSGKVAAVSDITIQVDNYNEINLPIALTEGESLVCDGTNNIRLYSANGRPKESYQLSKPLPIVSTGDHSIVFNCKFGDADQQKIELQFKEVGATVMVQSAK